MLGYRVIWLITLLILGLVGCNRAATAVEPTPLTAPNAALPAAEAPIYAAVLTQNEMLVRSETRPLWIAQMTNPYSAPDLALVESETFAHFVEANRQAYEMPPDLPIDTPYVYLSQADIEANVEAGTFYEGDLVTFSRVGFNREQNQALVYFGFSCGELCAGGYMVVLELEGNEWVIVDTVEVWLS